MRLPFIVLLFFLNGTALTAQPGPWPLVVKQLQAAQHDSARLRLCLMLARNYRATNQNDSLYRYVQEGLKIARRYSSPDQLSDFYYLLAMYYRNVGLYQKGIQPIKLAVQYAKKAADAQKVAKYEYGVAVLLADANELSSAIEQVEHNIASLQHQQQNSRLATNYLLIRSIAASMNNRPLERYYINAYLNLVKPSWSVDHRFDAHYLKGELLAEKGQFEAAEYQYRLGLACARQMGSQDLVIDVLRQLARNSCHQKRYPKAIHLLNEAYVLARRLHYQTNLAEVMSDLSTTYLAIGRLDQAERLSRESVRIERQEHHINGLIESLTNLVSTLEAKGKYQEALLRYRELQQIKEKRYTEKNARQITQMQARFEAEKKDKTIKILQKNDQINRLNAARQQQQISIDQRMKFAAVIIIGLFTLLTSVIYYFLRKSRRDFAALARQQQLLQQTTTALSESNTLKDKLFSLISHDLRSPLSSIKANIRQISESHQYPELLSPLLVRLDKQVDNVLGLLTNLLDWSMIQLKGFQPKLQAICLQDMIDDSSSQASELLRQKNLTLINQVDQSVRVLADKQQLLAVLRNVLSNAIKFTPAGGYIRIVSKKQDEYVELQIRDSGIGMSARQLATLFTSPEVRRGTMGESGTGLGIRICQEMLERQGGQLLIESQPERGTFVTIRLKVLSEEYQLQAVY